MKNIFRVIFTLCIIAIISCKKQTSIKTSNKIIFKGKVTNYNLDTLLLEDVTERLEHLSNKTYKIPLNKNKEFNFSFTSKEPRYYKISRNPFYLSPGDSIEVVFDYSKRGGRVIKGKGKEANIYLTSLKYPKGGSYATDKNFVNLVRTGGSYKYIPKAVDQFLSKEQERVNALKNVSDKFKETEKNRNIFDAINTLYYSTYYLFGFVEDKSAKEKRKVLKKYLKPFLVEKMKSVNNSMDYLALNVYHNILGIASKLIEDGYKIEKPSPEIKEYLSVSNLKRKIERNGLNNKIVAEVTTKIKEIKNEKYKEVLKKHINDFNSLLKGNDAYDFEMLTLDGDSINLSNYKGKIIVLDIWATWCGPCKTEKPFFKKLAHKYNNNSNVVFISLSTDKLEKWKNHFKGKKTEIKEFFVGPVGMPNYKIDGVPRFIIIDKDFKIYDAFAPMPSSGLGKVLEGMGLK